MDPTPHPILHIEDEDNDIHLLQRAFANAEICHPVQVVKTAARAYAYLLGTDPFERRNYFPLPSLILLDLSLPLLDGLKILRWRQKQPEIKRIPVLVLTATSQVGEVRAAYEEGANGYLVKPASFNGWVELVKAIQTFWLTQNIFPAPQIAHEQTMAPRVNRNEVVAV